MRSSIDKQPGVFDLGVKELVGNTGAPVGDPLLVRLQIKAFQQIFQGVEKFIIKKRFFGIAHQKRKKAVDVGKGCRHGRRKRLCCVGIMIRFH